MRTRSYPTDLTDAQWALVAPHIPAAKYGGRPRTTDVRVVFDAIMYLLRPGCQWRQLPSDFPPWPTVHGYNWRMAGVWVLTAPNVPRQPGPSRLSDAAEIPPNRLESTLFAQIIKD